MGSGAQTQWRRPWKECTLLSGQCDPESPGAASPPQCLTLALGSLYRFIPHLKQNETTPYALGSLPHWRRVNVCFCRIEAASYGTRILPRLGTFYTPRFRLSPFQLDPAFNLPSLLVMPYKCFLPIPSLKEAMTVQKNLTFQRSCGLWAKAL